jgi:2-oxoglutarate ferredoxin oxidoreductase subunit delta
MPIIKINHDWCKGCGLCIEICPKNVYDRESKVSSKGFRQIIIKNPDACNQCMLCELLCPDLSITVEKKEKDAKVSK